MLVAGVVRHQVQKDPDPANARLGDQRVDIVKRAQVRLHLTEVGDVVAPVGIGRDGDRAQPDRVDAQPGQVVEAVDDAGEISLAVGIGVGERPWIDLVQDGRAPPRRPALLTVALPGVCIPHVAPMVVSATPVHRHRWRRPSRSSGPPGRGAQHRVAGCEARQAVPASGGRARSCDPAVSRSVAARHIRPVVVPQGLERRNTPTGTRHWHLRLEGNGSEPPQPAGSGWNGCTVTQHRPWGMLLAGWRQSEDGGTLLWSRTTWYSVGP